MIIAYFSIKEVALQNILFGLFANSKLRLCQKGCPKHVLTPINDSVMFTLEAKVF